MSNLVSPDEMVRSAKEIMLDGREPESPNDWIILVNFFAYNAASGLETSVCRLMWAIYEIPLSESSIVAIAEYQAGRKGH